MNFYCNKCKKEYTSYQSYWYHNKKHKDNIIIDDNTTDNELSCNYCKKHFINKYSCKRHITKCNHKLFLENTKNNIITTKLDNETETETLKLKLKLTEAETIKIKEEQKLRVIDQDILRDETKNLELKLQLEKLLKSNCKVHHKTFKALNNKLILISKHLMNIK
jgi:hypothetical protein